MAKFNPNIDLSAVAEQFSGLQGRHPGLWPLVPRIALGAGLVVAVMAAFWFLHWQHLIANLEAGQHKEQQLKAEFRQKLAQAINLPVLRKQKEEVSKYVNQLEKQLPSKAEMDALLSDINQAGVGRKLQFELFKPGQVVLKDYYAELPIDVRVVGQYHDMGAFTSDISNMPRIVTLRNVDIKFNDDTGGLSMNAVARTYRYLDPEEIAAQRAQAAQVATAGRGAKNGAKR
ncbi:MAG: type 4a pilus biogenesis protein PilO [Burkholderiales bacterium]|nr:MAG: type 4a pilus biogenesis protein PilO [Burkholderiales bacterium]